MPIPSEENSRERVANEFDYWRVRLQRFYGINWTSEADQIAAVLAAASLRDQYE